MDQQNPSQRLLSGVPLVESPLFPTVIDSLDLTEAERGIALSLHHRGYAVFDFPDEQIAARIERIRADLGPRFDFDRWRSLEWAANGGMRAQDAWTSNADVRAIAVNAVVIELLSKLYGRRAFPFQTLNFPVGTQQHYHSDSIHFSTAPERFMCGVWLAMEDIHPAAGPLVYYPGSHRWPILSNDMIGREVADDRSFPAQEPFEPVWKALVESTGIEAELFTPKKGQALIWAANLLHGGSRQTDPALSRWSQVTHYYFEGCTYYTPAYSDPLVGNLAMRRITDIGAGREVKNSYLGRPIHFSARSYVGRIKRRLKALAGGLQS